MQKKILLLTKNYPPQIGWIEKYSQDLYLHLIKDGFQVRLIKASPRNEYLLSFSGWAQSFQKIFFKILYLFNEILRLFFFAFKCSTIGVYYSFKSDLIWNLDGSISFLSYFLGFFSQKPTQTTFHAKDVIWKNFFYQLIMPFFWKRIDNIFCVSNITKQELVSRGISANKIIIQENSAWNLFFADPWSFDKISYLSFYWIPRDKVLLFSIWRFVEKKGFHWFLSEVCPFINSQRCHYILVGSWPLALLYKQIIKDKMIKNVTLIWAITDPIEKARLFTIANYLIVPNIFIEWDREWSPIVLAEAKYYNLPCILSDIDELVFQAGPHCLLPPQDKDAWINKIDKLC